MNRRTAVSFIVLTLLFGASLILNVLVYRKAKSYQLQLNTVRLDPTSLRAFPLAEPSGSSPIIVIYGDSRAAEWPVSPQLGSYTVINRGIPGQTSAQVLGRFHQHVAPLKPQKVLLQCGVNDLILIPDFPAKRDAIIEGCKANIGQIVKESVDSGARVIVTTIFPLGPFPAERRATWPEVAKAIDEVNVYLKTLASERVSVFETRSVLADAQGLVDPRLSRDVLHLEPEGYKALNEALTGRLTR